MEIKKLEKEFAFVGATLIDGTGASAKKDAVVVVKDGSIAEVGDRRSVRLPADIQQVDVSGKFLTPGLIDCHVHLGGTRSSNMLGFFFDSQFERALRGARYAFDLVDWGITSCGDAGSGDRVLAIRNVINEGVIVGPRVISCGSGLCRTGGHMTLPQINWRVDRETLARYNPTALQVDGVEECRKAVRELLSRDVDMIKVWETGGYRWHKDRYEDVHFTFEELKTICNEAHMVCNTRVRAHSKNIRGHKMCLNAGVDFIDHFCFSKGEEIDDELIQKMLERNVSFCATIAVYVMAPGEDMYWTKVGIPEWTRRSWMKAVEAGIKIAMGSDMFMMREGETWGPFNIRELKLMTEIIGLSPTEALVASTKNAAEALGLGDITGTIEKGKWADILIVKENPLENITCFENKENTLHVIKEGKLIR